MNLFDNYEHEYVRLGSHPTARGVVVSPPNTGEYAPTGPDGFGVEILSDLHVQSSLLETLDRARDEGQPFDLVNPTLEDVEMVVRDALEQMGKGAIVVVSPMVLTLMNSRHFVEKISGLDDARPALVGNLHNTSGDHLVFLNDQWNAQQPILVCGDGWFRHVYRRGIYTETTDRGTFVRSDIQTEFDPKRVLVIRTDFSNVRVF